MNSTKPKILCVDIEPMFLEPLDRLLLAGGYEVRKTRNGEEALKTVNEEKIDLVLLDVRTPALEGIEVCRRIKADENSMHIPVVLITGFMAQEDRVKGIEAGAEDFISKPYDPAELLARIKRLLKAKHIHERRIGELLIDMKFINDEQLQEALRIANERRIKVGEALLAMGALDKDHIYWVLSNQLDMNYVEPSLEMIDREWIRQFPITTLEELQCLPLYEAAGEIHFALADPTNPEARRAILDLQPSKKTRLHLALPEKIGAILETIKKEFGSSPENIEPDAQTLHPSPFPREKPANARKKEKQWNHLVEVLFSMDPDEACWLYQDGQEGHFLLEKGDNFETVDQYTPEVFDLFKQKLQREPNPRNGKGVGYLFLQKKVPKMQGAFKIWFLNALGKELIKIGRLPTFVQEDFFFAHPRALASVDDLQQRFGEYRCLVIGGSEKLMIKQCCYWLWKIQGLGTEFPPALFVENELEMVFPEVVQLSSSQFDLVNFLDPLQGQRIPFVFYEAPLPEISPVIRKLLSGHPQNIIFSIPFSSLESMAKALRACPERREGKVQAIFLQGDQWKVL